MVVGGGDVQLLPVTSNTVAEQLVKMIPDLVNRVNNLIAQNREKKNRKNLTN